MAMFDDYDRNQICRCINDFIISEKRSSPDKKMSTLMEDVMNVISAGISYGISEAYDMKSEINNTVAKQELILQADGYKLYNREEGKFCLVFPSGEGMELTKETLVTYFQKIYNDLF